jgi:phage-related holin
MNTLSIFKYPLLLITGTSFATSFAWLSVKYLPSLMIFFWLVIAVLGDLLTGLLKAWAKGQATSSTGLRRTATKIGSYCGAIIVVIILINMLGIVDTTNSYNLKILIDGLIGFMVFIELYSICENISEAYPNSPLTLWLIEPIMLKLKGKFLKPPTPLDDTTTPSKL